MSDPLQHHGLQHARPPCHHQLPKFTQTQNSWVKEATDSYRFRTKFLGKRGKLLYLDDGSSLKFILSVSFWPGCMLSLSTVSDSLEPHGL